MFGVYCVYIERLKKNLINIFTLLAFMYSTYQKGTQINGLFTIHSSSHYIYIFSLSCPFLFHFCELVCSLLYSSMNLLALVVVKFLNMLLCFYLNSSLLYASSRIRILNKLYTIYRSFERRSLAYFWYDSRCFLSNLL